MDASQSLFWSPLGFARSRNELSGDDDGLSVGVGRRGWGRRSSSTAKKRKKGIERRSLRARRWRLLAKAVQRMGGGIDGEGGLGECGRGRRKGFARGSTEKPSEWDHCL
ncbi:hypothetical protein Droror1_Dr00022813 [Drosera rotundifolia]